MLIMSMHPIHRPAEDPLRRSVEQADVIQQADVMQRLAATREVLFLARPTASTPGASAHQAMAQRHPWLALAGAAVVGVVLLRWAPRRLGALVTPLVLAQGTGLAKAFVQGFLAKR